MTIDVGQAPSVALVSMSRLTPAEWNPRTIKDKRFKNLMESIKADPEFLWRRPILANAEGVILAGNMRYRAAKELGMSDIPAILDDISDQLAKERALRDNAQWGEWEDTEVAQLLAELENAGSPLALLGFEDTEVNRLLGLLKIESTALGDGEAIPELSGPVRTQPGDLWALGDHRIMCGDSTNPEHMSRLMEGRRAELMWTDPPYGVGIVGGDYMKPIKERRAEGYLEIQGDTEEGLAGLIYSAFKTAENYALTPGCPAYISHPPGALHLTFGNAILACGWRLHETLIWVKDQMVPGHSDYHLKHEPIYLCYLPGGEGRSGRGGSFWYGPNNAVSTLEFARPKRSKEHPTSKPTPLIEAMLENSSRVGTLVLDPFIGSGSTLIACQNLGRICYGMDIDPHYVEVAVRRWEQYTGSVATLITG